MTWTCRHSSLVTLLLFTLISHGLLVNHNIDHIDKLVQQPNPSDDAAHLTGHHETESSSRTSITSPSSTVASSSSLTNPKPPPPKTISKTKTTPTTKKLPPTVSVLTSTPPTTASSSAATTMQPLVITIIAFSGLSGLCGVAAIFLIFNRFRGNNGYAFDTRNMHRLHDINYASSMEGYGYRRRGQSPGTYRRSFDSEIESPMPVWAGTSNQRHRLSTNEYMNPFISPRTSVDSPFEGLLRAQTRLHPTELRCQEEIEMANLSRRVTSVHYPIHADRHG